jgi:hypothetical protein
MAISFMGLLLLFHPALRGSNDELQCLLLRIVIGATGPARASRLGQGSRHPYARTALSLDTDDATALSLAGFVVISLEHDHKAGISATERALLHNPNSSQALGYSAVVNSLVGRFETALDRARQSIQLSPFDPLNYIPETATCTAFFCLGRYAEATSASTERSIQYNPRFVPGYALRAATFTAGSP